MSEKNIFALVPRAPSSLERAEPGARRIMSGMVADALALAQKGHPRSHRPLRIVSVDDEELRLAIVEGIISGHFRGVIVQSFRDAEEAWQELLRSDPDLLITDDIMGNLNGRDIVRRLADRKVAYPIIVIQGCPERDQWVLDCVKQGEDVTLLRAPYDVESLVRALESALGISRDTKGPVEIAAHPASASSVDAEALYQKACAYYRGDGVPQDYTEAVKWFRKAADRGLAKAQNMVGVCYTDGRGVSEDIAEAAKWYRRAAENGNADGQHNLGICYFKGWGVPLDYVQVAKWDRKAAEQGHRAAQLCLGISYFIGEGVPQDFAEAAKWYRKAAEQGNANAQLRLGYCYRNGQGVPQDDVEAVKWFRKSAEQNDGRAQYEVGVCYDTGEGVLQDSVEALRWWRKAAEQGISVAQLSLGDHYHRGQGAPRDEVKALKWFRNAAEQGDADAQFMLGAWYCDWLRDRSEAVEWLRKAAGQGLDRAKELLLTLDG
jgi:hypothetical protein